MPLYASRLSLQSLLRILSDKQTRHLFHCSNQHLFPDNVSLRTIRLFRPKTTREGDVFRKAVKRNRQVSISHLYSINLVSKLNSYLGFCFFDSSLFPAQVRDRLLQDENDNKNRQGKIDLLFPFSSAITPEASKRGFAAFKSKPIADLFPSATVMFADIEGFTAWSSVREPAQVFTLLEAVYVTFDGYVLWGVTQSENLNVWYLLGCLTLILLSAFQNRNSLANRRRVFKVETIGDCYVAVAGLPEARPDHALVMARFANDCRTKLISLVHQLEVELGPDTGAFIFQSDVWKRIEGSSLLTQRHHLLSEPFMLYYHANQYG